MTKAYNTEAATKHNLIHKSSKSFMPIRRILFFIVLPLAVLSSSLLTACHNESRNTAISHEEKRHIDSLVNVNRDEKALNLLFKKFTQSGNSYGEVAVCRELGKCYRENSRFEDAIEIHKKGLKLATAMHDTAQIIQALNNIGTNFRRMGILDEASSFHYQALAYCDAYSDKTSEKARKSRVVTLNGIGNTHLTLGNKETADSVFRLALAGEKSLGSALGQAINYANIGSIFENYGKIDSAKYYYDQSMKFNREAKSTLGISLCHTHLGRLYEKNKDYSKAAEEFKKAYDIMFKEKDDWHKLESELALARINIKLDNMTAARTYIDDAKTTAISIHSLEHLASVYELEYKWYKKNGDDNRALDCFVKSKNYDDSVSNEKNMSHMQNVRIRYERQSKQNEINHIQQNYQNERKIKNTILISAILVLLLACIAILSLWIVVRLRSKNQRMLKEVEKVRTSFFTNITHEFRTPLTVIQSAAQDIMRRSPADEEIRHDANAILRHENSLLNLINQILDIAKMSSGVVPALKWKHGDIVGFASMICESHKAYAADKGIKLVYSPQEDCVEMDFIPDYVQKIIQNIIANAIKFSPAGSEVIVSTHLENSTLRISVSDKGKGMTDEQKANIFKPFYQADNDSSIGTGIGLSLVKITVDAMKGSIDVHSEPGDGSVFIVSLPVRNCIMTKEPFNENDYAVKPLTYITEDDEEQLDDDNTDDDDATRILIIEDTPEVAQYMVRQLNQSYSYYYAADGTEGLKKAEEIVPDLIVTDIMMAGIDGFELCRQVRSSELLNHIPVIMVTAKATHEDRMQGLEAGADAYLEKPFQSDELNIRVEKLLEQRRLMRRKFSQAVENDDIQDDSLPSKDKVFVEKLTDAVDTAIKKGKIDYDVLAYNQCLSRTQLNRKLKAITGYTTTNFILCVRMSMAKKLLDSSDMSIGDIAFRCGIDNIVYFSSLFKKTCGMTATQYKNRKR